MPQFSPGETYIPHSTCRLSQTSFETINKNALGIPLAWQNQGTRHRLERRSSVSAHTLVAHLAHTLVALLGSLRLPQTLASRHTLVAHLASRRHLPLAEPPAASCTHPPREGPGTHSLLLYFSPLPALLRGRTRLFVSGTCSLACLALLFRVSVLRFCLALVSSV